MKGAGGLTPAARVGTMVPSAAAKASYPLEEPLDGRQAEAETAAYTWLTWSLGAAWAFHCG